jgi:cation transport ATPase
MNKTFVIEGMHCNACEKLIEMDLEENGFVKENMSFDLLGDNKGSLSIKLSSEEEIQKITNSINRMEGYMVIKIHD